MRVEVEDVLFWMDAIRNADNRDRVLESFWKGQIHSKEWLILNLEPFTSKQHSDIVIHGGWFGVLSTLLFNSRINVDRILSIDIDPECEPIAYTINKNYEISGKFKAKTQNMLNYDYSENRADIVINTSCEHITEDEFVDWYNKIPFKSLFALQSNNFFSWHEHINCANNIGDFISKTHIPTNDIFIQDELELQKYTRFLLIGRKHVQIQ